MGKFTYKEMSLVKSIIATLSIERIPEPQIIDEIFRQTNKKITRTAMFKIKRSIKQESAKWYGVMRENKYEYIHQFKERIDEILWLQKKHYEIIASDKESTKNKQSSLEELHRLNITLSNYVSVTPAIANSNDFTISTIPENKSEATNDQEPIV